ncbi:subtilase family domain-containing protein [Trichoderma breve]|uniref:Subtilase family domain-containing protein n=1 Tax=Trichoderma breve TaxID=2034170 RepID=A0A9W9E8T8_9HYPO|nr:subtilase family domain-containing protein [Trichoderma breve]KAJ4860797.1 subtilase family domain-containing protein [Trichoderma breve]
MSAYIPTESTEDWIRAAIQRLADEDILSNRYSVTPVAALEGLLLPQINTEQREAHMYVLGYDVGGYSPAKEIDIYNMHKKLAKKYQEISRKTETDEDVLSGLRSDEENKGSQKFLEYLFDLGPGGSTVLHVILEPNTYEGDVFQLDPVKPLIRFFLRLYPDLPTTTNYKYQPPIYLSLRSTGAVRFTPNVKEDIIRFLCEEQDEGLGSEAAIKSLAQMVNDSSDPLDRCHAIHKIIESANFEISEAVMRELSKTMTSRELYNRIDTNCFEARDVEMYPDLLKLVSTIKETYSNQEQQVTPLQYFAKQRFSAAQFDRGGEDKEVSSSLADLESHLRCQCLVKFDYSTCMRIMFDKESARQIFLTLDDDIVSGEFLESQKLHYKLDTTLKRVHISNSVSFQWDELSLGALKTATRWKCAGNFDLFMVFYWLKYNIGVKKILEVVVDDGAGQEESTGDVSEIKKKPHSDQAIIECLKHLSVETLDWKRMDIPAEVIIEGAGKDIKRLHLYCSGSQAVLQSWADSNGLSKLQNGLESFYWANEHAEKLQTDLKRKFEELNPGKKSPVVDYRIIRPKKALDKSASSEVINQDERKFEEQDWLKCMDEFADIMEVVEQQPDFLSIGIQKSTHPIRVALIDDGVKTSYAGLDNNISTGKSSWKRPDSKNTRTGNTQWEQFRSYNSSHTGHGTVMAYYIKRVCPRVSLYVAKLDCKPHRGGVSGYSANVTFSIDSVAQAIEWAVEQEVDIISMSWAIEKSNTLPYRPLCDAIQKAVEKKIILFCANPDRGTGYTVNDTYPWSLDQVHIICVGAATQSGVPWNQIDANDKSCQYLLPGVELGIQVETKRRRNPDGPPPRMRELVVVRSCNRVSGYDIALLLGHWSCDIRQPEMGVAAVPRRHMQFFGPAVNNPNEDSDTKVQAIQSLIKDIFQGMPSH